MGARRALQARRRRRQTRGVNVGARALERMSAAADGVEVTGAERRENLGQALIAAADEGLEQLALKFHVPARELTQGGHVDLRVQVGLQVPAETENQLRGLDGFT